MNDRHQQDAENRLNNLMREIGNVQTLGEEEYAELGQIAQRLAGTNLSNRSRIRAQLYQQLKHAHSTQKSHSNGDNNAMMNAPLKRLVATAAVMLALLVTVPALTVLAQTILGQIGPITVTNEQENLPLSEGTTVDKMQVTPTPIPPDVRENLPTAPITSLDGAIATNLSAEAAAEIAGFDFVREPSALPTGYEFGGRSVFGGGSTTVDSFWQRPGSFGDSLVRVSISQSIGNFQNTYRVGPQAQSAEVTIGSISATLITNADLSSSDGQMFNLLLWEEGDYLYVMASPSLSRDEMLALAESMYR